MEIKSKWLKISAEASQEWLMLVNKNDFVKNWTQNEFMYD